MKECLIEGCPNEAFPVIKTRNKTYYACKKHEKEAEHIALAEKHANEELERIKKVRESLLKEREEKPFWIKF